MNRHLVVGLLQVVSVILGFNLDTNNTKIFVQNPESYFGYKVCHFGPKHSNSVLVTSPLHEDGTGGVYKCSYKGQCELLPMKVNPGISFGMSLACTADRAMVCGPRLTQECNHLNYLNGLCVEIGPRFTENKNIKPAFQECRNISLDAVILFDSSQSIFEKDFKTMIEFIKDIIRMFKDPGTQVAVAQYATDYHAVFNFENFAAATNPVDLMNDVTHEKGNTYTAAAIRFVLETMFTVDKGMQKDSKKLLIVITDGKSNDPSEKLDAVLPLAQAMNVTIYAIGVGNEFSNEELLKIALNNSTNVLETKSFDALSSIQSILRSKIFAIEGTGVVSNHSSFEKELSQGGFSIALSEDESTFGAVGAYTWSGGLEKYGVGLGTAFINASAEERDLRYSYMGYSVTILNINQRTVYFSGAPRYNHTGLVLGFQQLHGNDTWTVSYRIHGSQFGSYFGSALCTLTGKSYGKNGILVIGAPFFHGKGVGGEVRICQMEYETPNCTQNLTGASGNNHGQFGASLSSCPDLNGDGVPELAVGAPFENKGKGSLYIFLSHSKGLETKYSQRITGSQLDNRLQYFGLSVHSAGDLSADGLTDLVVGGRGSATIVRSHPVMCLRVSVTLDPPVIPQNLFHCSDPSGLNSPVSTVRICTTLEEVLKGTLQTPFRAAVTMNLELDQENRGKSPPRLNFFSTPHWNMSLVGSQTFCQELNLTLPDCISDYHEPLLAGKLLADIEDIPGSGGLRPMHSPDCPLSFLSQVPLEKVCGEDHVCVSDLHVSVNFKSPVVVNTTSFPVDVSVDVLNNGEDASAITLELYFPSALSFSQAFTQQTVDRKPVRCGLSSAVTGPFSLINCELGSAVIRQRATTTVQISLMVSDPTSLNDKLSVNVSVMSNNEDVQTLQDNSARATVPVKLPFNAIIQDGASTRYISFPKQTQLRHEFKVENIGESAVPAKVTFVVPVEMDSGFLWAVALEGQKEKCFDKRVSEKENKHCKTEACHLFECAIYSLAAKQPISFTFSGVVSRNIRGSGVQVKVESWAFLSFDETLYTQFPVSGGLSDSIVSELEVPSQGPATIIATVSVLCALIILLIISGILYKVGFFKSKKEAGEDSCALSAQEGEGTSPPADQSPDTPQPKVNGDAS